MKRTKYIVLTAICSLAIVACGDSEETEGDTGFSGGSFNVTVLSVQDNCFDGAMNTIVLPDGTPNDLPAPVSIPAYSNLPAAVDIEFNAPFQSTSGVQFEVFGENGLRTAGNGFEQTGVDIAGDGEDCVATMTVTAEFISSGPDSFTGTGTLTITSAEGDDCPAFQTGPPCTVTTPMSAARVN
ncbi:MAG: hypothetical protein ACNA8W_06740 [Bradymonadaceae bacterium]